MTTESKFTVAIIHPQADIPMVVEAILAASGFVTYQHWIWAQSNGPSRRHADLFVQNRVSYFSVSKYVFFYSFRSSLWPSMPDIVRSTTISGEGTS